MKYKLLIIVLISFCTTIYFLQLNLMTTNNHFVKIDMNKDTMLSTTELSLTLIENYTTILNKDQMEHVPFEKHHFNTDISNRIALNRYIPDTRDTRCKERIYKFDNTKTTSIIITFYNEAKSILLRTITSILNRTPSDLLNEIILIDDCSTTIPDEYNRTFLENYHRKIVYIRNFEREGLIRSRNIGVKYARGDYILFLDSHCEMNVHWLEPLLERLFVQPNAAVSPIIDVIDPINFQYKGSSAKLKGGFDWSLHFKWIPISREEQETRNDESLPFTSPSMAGGIFILSKEWFHQLGGFDNSLEIWGGESLEMSLKLWMCGGQIEICPCSRIGHIFRKKHPYEFPLGNTYTYLKNSKRIAELWLQEYKHFFYSSRLSARNIDIESVTAVQQLQKQLQCHRFSWYLQNVFQELRIPSDENIAFGELKHGSRCLDVIGENSTVALNDCEVYKQRKWMLNKLGYLNIESGGCLNVIYANRIALEYCKNKTNLLWHRKGGTLVHTESGKCLENFVGFSVGVSMCRRGAPSQLWSFSIEIEQLRH